MVLSKIKLLIIKYFVIFYSRIEQNIINYNYCDAIRNDSNRDIHLTIGCVFKVCVWRWLVKLFLQEKRRHTIVSRDLSPLVLWLCAILQPCLVIRAGVRVVVDVHDCNVNTNVVTPVHCESKTLVYILLCNDLVKLH